MDYTGKVIYIGEIQTGFRKTDGAEWRKQTYAIETQGKFPKKIAFSLMNAKIDDAAIKMGDTVQVDIDAQSREWQGKWYTDLNAWRIQNMGPTVPTMEQQPVYAQQAPAGYASTQAPQHVNQTNNIGSDLPF